MGGQNFLPNFQHAPRVPTRRPAPRARFIDVIASSQSVDVSLLWSRFILTSHLFKRYIDRCIDRCRWIADFVLIYYFIFIYFNGKIVSFHLFIFSLKCCLFTARRPALNIASRGIAAFFRHMRAAL